MLVFIIRRLLQAIPTLFGVSLIAFALLKAVPGDPARILAGKNATPIFLANERHTLKLDEPYWMQYKDFVGGALDFRWPYTSSTGFQDPWNPDFGQSWAVQRYTSVSTVIAQKFPRTAALAISAIIIEIIFGIGLGIFSALKHRTRLDTGVTVVNLGIYALPVFVFGVALQIVFCLPHNNLFGTGVGFDTSNIFNIDTDNPPSFLGAFNPVFFVQNLLLPSITLAMVSVASTALVMRTSLLEVVRADYMKTARAKGLSPRKVIGKHALKNALLPMITIIGLDLGIILGGAVITESIWNWDGIGRLQVTAIGARDAPVAIVVTMLLALIFVVVSVLIDILYAFANPRIRLQDIE